MQLQSRKVSYSLMKCFMGPSSSCSAQTKEIWLELSPKITLFSLLCSPPCVHAHAEHTHTNYFPKKLLVKWVKLNNFWLKTLLLEPLNNVSLNGVNTVAFFFKFSCLNMPSQYIKPTSWKLCTWHAFLCT